MFEYFLAGFTGTFFSYYVVFQCGAVVEYYFGTYINKNKKNDNLKIYENDIMYLKYRLDEVGDTVNKVIKKIDNLENNSIKSDDPLESATV